MDRHSGDNFVNGNHGHQTRTTHLGTVKERSSERDTTSEEKGEEITNGRHEAISSMMRADHHENQMRTREDRSTPMELSAQELDGILYAITILDDDPAQNNNLASLLSDGPGGTGLAEGDYGKFPGGKHYGAELPRNLSDTVQKLVQGGVPTQFLPHNTSLNSTAEAQGDSASRPGAKGINERQDDDTIKVKVEGYASAAKQNSQEADDDDESGGANGSGRKAKDVTKSSAAINEKQRRDNMKKLFQELKDVVPDTTKADRATVLEMSIKYIKNQQQQISALIEELNRMRMQQSLFPLSAYGQQINHNRPPVIHSPSPPVHYDTGPDYNHPQMIQTGHMADNHSCLGYNTVEAADANCAPFNTFAQMRSHLPRYSEGAISGSANSSYQNRESYGGVGGIIAERSAVPPLGSQHYNGNAAPDIHQEVTIDRVSDDVVCIRIQALERRGLLHDLIKSVRSLPLEILQASIRSTGGGYADNEFSIRLHDQSIDLEDLRLLFLKVINQDQRAGDKRARFTREESFSRGDAM